MKGRAGKSREGILLRVFNHFRLSFRLTNDPRVSIWPKLFLMGLPLAYTAFPTPGDVTPLLGMADDLVFLVVCTLVFNAICPRAIVKEHYMDLRGLVPFRGVNLDRYRHPRESLDLAIGFTIVFALLAVVGWFAGLLGMLLFGLGYLSTNLVRGQMLANSVRVTERQLPRLFQRLQVALQHLPPLEVELFVFQNPTMNAYTFGYREPYTVLLTSALVEKLDDQELQAVIGHELGHVLFDHVRIKSLTGLGGRLLQLLFYRWGRSCEYSADAIALLASGGDPAPMVSAMLKLSSGLSDVSLDLDAFLGQVDDADGAGRYASVAEGLSTHPFILNRIRRLIEIAGKRPAQDLLQPGGAPS
ncbi:MAG: M48 family metallopeptidase [Anaerolineae bacterium]|nr:M48 family metallopeptidase [Anaerolineae bacterium]